MKKYRTPVQLYISNWEIRQNNSLSSHKNIIIAE